MTDDNFPYEDGDDSKPSRVVHYKAEADFDTLVASAPGIAALADIEGILGADEYEDTYRDGLLKASTRLEEYFPALDLSTPLNGACPVQAEGFFKGEGIYLRYRSDHATVRILNEDGSLGDLLAEDTQVSGDHYRGSLSQQEAVRVFRRLLKKTKKALKQRAKEQR